MIKNPKVNLRQARIVPSESRAGKKHPPKKLHRRKGAYLPLIMMVSVLFLAYAVMMAIFSVENIKTAVLQNKRITSMAIAEAGVNYYMWHLSHNNSDYCDGNTPCEGSGEKGPYTHEYKDQDGNSLGTYDIFITPPGAGSSTTIVKSVGKVNGISPTRTIIAELGMPSFTKYTVFKNGNNLTLGTDGVIDGSVHVNNGGLYNLGSISGDASSTETTYVHPTYGLVNGVDGPGYFGGAKISGTTTINVNQVSADIVNLRTVAFTDIPSAFNESSGKRGYRVVLNHSSYDLYKVNNFSNQTLDITSSSLVGNYPYPPKGVLFFEDNIWVSGEIDNQKVTLVASDPDANINQRKFIIIPGNIQFTNYDGSDKIGLISQTDILVSKNSPTDLRIDAALLAINGDIGIDNFGEIKNSLTIYGSRASIDSYWQYYQNGNLASGFRNRTFQMDTYNVLNPPPEFPKTGVYAIMSWREE